MDDNLLEFGIKRDNEERRDGGGAVIFDPETKKFGVYKMIDNGYLGLFGGGVDEGENIKECVVREIIEESGLNDFSYIEELGEVLAHYHHNRKKLNRITKAKFYLFILKSKNVVETKHEEHENFFLFWACLDEILSDLNSRNQDKNYDHWLYFLDKAEKRIRELGHDIVLK